jgi:UDP-glucose 4-epimerase
VQANLCAADCKQTGAVNIGSGVETSVLQLVAELETLGRSPLAPAHAPAREGEVVRSCLDASRARALLGWEASVPLAEGLRRTLAHVAGDARLVGPGA